LVHRLRRNKRVDPTETSESQSQTVVVGNEDGKDLVRGKKKNQSAHDRTGVKTDQTKGTAPFTRREQTKKKVNERGEKRL